MSYDPNYENNDFTEGTPTPEPSLSPEEIKRHKGVFSKLCLAYFAYLVITNLLAFGAGLIIANYFPEYAESYNVSITVSSVIQYVIALPILVLMMKKIPSSTLTRSKLGMKDFLKCGVASVFVMYIGNYVSTLIMSYMEMWLGYTPENSVDSLLDGTNVILSIVFVGLIGPIVEEFMFRKLAIDRLIPYGEAVAIVFPSLIFGLFHGNLYQLFYAFLLGMAFSFIYVKTGRMIYSTLLHIFINLFCGVFPSVILGMLDYEELIELVYAGTLTEEYIQANALPIALLGIYEVVMLAMITAGVVVILRNLRNIRLNKGEVRLVKGTRAEIMFGSVGTIVLIAACIAIIALNTFAQ